MSYVFVPRTIAPSTSDKNWISTAYGGYNKCIIINSSTGSCLPNCVGYAWGRFREINGSSNLSLNNARRWYGYTEDGYKRGKVPQVGAVLCFDSTVGKAGHVAIVEKINADGSIDTSESGYGGTRWFYTTGRKPPNYTESTKYAFQGFIYNPKCEEIEDSLTKFTKAAERHIGNFSKWAYANSGQTYPNAWSAAFVVACAKDAGILGKLIPKSYSSSDLIRIAVDKKMGTWLPGPHYGADRTPEVGDIVSLVYTGTLKADRYHCDHSAIVVEVFKDKIRVIEGDVHGKVVSQYYSRQSNFIASYYRPNWIETSSTQANSITYTLSTDLYKTENDSNDAIMREVGYMSSSSAEPSIKASDMKLSVINYTSALASLFKNVASQYNDTIVANAESIQIESTFSTDTSVINQNEQVAINYLVSKGLCLAASVGIVANIHHESGCNPASYTSNDAGDGPSGGICQWHNSIRYKSHRFDNMKAYVGSNWKSNLTGQLDYLWKDLTGGYPGLFNTLKEVKNTVSGAQYAADRFVTIFEVPGDLINQSQKRQETATKFWNAITKQLK